MKKIISLIFLICVIILYVSTVSAAEIAFSDISVDVENSVVHNLVLPDTWEGNAVVWTTDGTYVKSDGTVNRPFPNDAENVLITAEYGGNTTAFSVTIKAFESKKEIVEKAALYFPFTAISSDNSNFLENDLFLPSEGLYGTKIIWTSDNSSLIKVVSDNNGNYIGEVNKSYFGEGNYGVCLTAIFYYDNEFCEKNFYLNVAEEQIGYTLPEELVNARNLYRDEFLKHNNIFDIKNDLILPPAPDGILIEYSSENQEIVTNNGVVTRDKNSNKTVEFRITFSQSYIKTNLTIPLKITAFSDDELEEIPKIDVKNILAQISRDYTLNALVNNMTLAKVGDNGSKITWTSSDSSAISNEGVINRGEKDKKATLTVTAEFNGHLYSETIDVVVKKNSQSVTTGTPEVGGGGSGISREPKPDPNTQPSNEKVYFKDLSSSHWAYESIMSLIDSNVVSGYSDNTFRPDSAVSREEFVKMLLLATNSYENGFNSDFGDVSKDSWFYPYVSCAFEKGIVQGISENKFGSGAKITREDTAVMICRALGIESSKVNTDIFPDFEQISDYAQPAVSTLYERGIVNGDENGYFNPKNNITRAEVSKILDLIR